MSSSLMPNDRVRSISLMPRPLISIVIPVFNQKPDYFRRAIKSALAQSGQDIEVVVSDNHSTNGCHLILDEFDDPRLRVVRPPKHLPIIQHFAYGGFQASGEYISLLPSDDWLESNWLAEMLAALQQHPEASFAYCDLYKHDLKSGQTSRFRGKNYAARYFTDADAIRMFGKLITRETSAFLIGALIRSEAYFRCGGIHDAGALYAGDLTIGLALLKFGGVVYVDQPLANHTVWTWKEGKTTEAKWYAITCQDTAKILAWAQNDLLLDEIAKRAKFSFSWARVRITAFFLLSYIQMTLDESDDKELLNSFQKSLKKLSNGWLPIWSTTLFRNAFVGYVMSYLRARVGPRVKSFFL